MLKQNKYYSYNLGLLPKGCQYCVRGEKLVIFITGICPRKCYFCPVSDQKYQQDVTFANEREVKDVNDLINEAELMRAKGAGITGGDPLAKLDRTINYIKKLKEHFGKEFHIHLYTSLNLVKEETLKQLSKAGLDEIRFHLDLDDQKLWKRLELALDWDAKRTKSFCTKGQNSPFCVGIEIPLIPSKEKETKQLIDFINKINKKKEKRIPFLNLNELEVADNKQSKLLEMNHQTKDQLSYAIKGSLELGLKLIEHVKEKEYRLKVHLCTAKLKDAVQLANRIKREAKNVKHDFDIVDKEGMLIRGALYLDELKPGFNYREKLKTIDKSKYIKKLELLLNKIKDKLKLNEKEIIIDQEKPRILLSKKLVKKKKKFFKKLGLLPAIVTEYPTADQLEIEIEFI